MELDNLTTWGYVQTYTALGFVCVPLIKETKRPALASWTPYQTRKPTQEELERWFLDKDVGVGIVTGKISNLSVVDSDSYHPGATQLNLQTPLIAQSGSGGKHYYFRHVSSLPAFKNHALHVELLSAGSIVCAPPTIHPNGNPYTWQTPLIESVSQLPLCPDDVLKYAPVQKSGKFDWKRALNVQQGARDETIYRAATSLAAKKFEFETALAILRGVNASYIPPLEDPEVIKKLKNAFAFVESQPISENKERRILRSGRVLPANNIANDISKRPALDELRRCNYRTSPTKIAELLSVVFLGCETYKVTHWLYIAERWAPRPIILTLNQILKRSQVGGIIGNAAALFTFKIRFRKIRRKLRNVQPANDKLGDRRIVVSQTDSATHANNTPATNLAHPTNNVQPANDIKSVGFLASCSAAPTSKPNGVQTVTYAQLEPWQRYYYAIASRGGEESYIRRLSLKRVRPSLTV